MKLELLRQDPFAFFRGTNPLFLAFLPRAHPLFRAPSILVCGDLHLENFGAFRGDNRLCYFDVNDFDDACRAPFTIDIVRFIAGVYLAAQELELDRRAAKRLVRHFVLAYRESIADGKPRWLERTLAKGVFRALLRRAILRTRRASTGSTSCAGVRSPAVIGRRCKEWVMSRPGRTCAAVGNMAAHRYRCCRGMFAHNAGPEKPTGWGKSRLPECGALGRCIAGTMTPVPLERGPRERRRERRPKLESSGRL